jgi:asparagine synthase (glutamine-hydrolysing)
MCGIAGWVDFGRDLTEERSTLDAMTGALANRGPDARGTWLAPHAALGHTRNSVIDLMGGVQPMTAEDDGQPVAVLTYSGEVYNFRELRTELEAHGHRFRTRSDTEVVLRSYLEWGDDCGNHLEGMFAFAVWDVRARELLLVRDRLGIKPLFYSVLPDGMLFASEPKALLANRLVRPVVDANGLRELFSTAKTPGQAVFANMRELLPGHTLRIRAGGTELKRYWRLEARPHTDDLPATIAHVRSLLTDIVTRELVADVPLCSLLSGGIDSSTVTALANAARLAQGDEPVRTLTTTFVGYNENFQRDDTRDTPDGPYATELARHVGTEHIDIVLGTADLMAPEARLAALLSQDMPTTLGDMDISAYLMFRATREHSTVALTGETADEIFAGFKWLHDPDEVAAENYPWVAREKRMAGAKAGQGRGLFDAGLMDKLDMPAYYADSYQQAKAEVPHQEGEDREEFRMREQTYFHLARWLPMLLDRDDRLAMASGLETRVPFCDHRLVEYVYNTPWKYKNFDSREKSLLRAAVKDLLPQSILDRPKSPYPVTQDPSYTQALHREMAAVLAAPNSPVLPLLNTEATRQAIINSTGPAHEWHSRMNVEMALAFNTWMTHYDVELTI